MKESVSEKIHLRIEERLYREFQLLHLDFLEKTEYIEVTDVKNFFILLIKEWEEFLVQQGLLYKAEENIIEGVNRTGKRMANLSYQGQSTRITFYLKKPIKQMWDNIIYSLMKQEEFANIGQYTNGYFFPKMFEFFKERMGYLIEKYKKTILSSYELAPYQEVKIKVLNKNSVKDFKGRIEKIEQNPDGISIYLERER